MKKIIIGFIVCVVLFCIVISCEMLFHCSYSTTFYILRTDKNPISAGDTITITCTKYDGRDVTNDWYDETTMKAVDTSADFIEDVEKARDMTADQPSLIVFNFMKKVEGEVYDYVYIPNAMNIPPQKYNLIEANKIVCVVPDVTGDVCEIFINQSIAKYYNDGYAINSYNIDINKN